jgi:hypothetical protein
MCWRKEFANEIANEPRRTRRYRAPQARIIEAKMSNQSTLGYGTARTSMRILELENHSTVTIPFGSNPPEPLAGDDARGLSQAAAAMAET